MKDLKLKFNEEKAIFRNPERIKAKEEAVFPESQSVSEKRFLPSTQPCLAGLFY